MMCDAVRHERGNRSTPDGGHHGQAFLVGNEISIHPIEKEDAEAGMSWCDTPYPLSPDSIARWISERMVHDRDTEWYAIVRRVDDRVVGSATVHLHEGTAWLDLYADPLYGAPASRWRGETLSLIVSWMVDERAARKMRIYLAADDHVLIAAARASGMRQTARLREIYDHAGGRVDLLVFEYHNTEWLGALGDPMETPLPRTGADQPGSVPAHAPLPGDPPRNAVLIGERVYIRPFEREDAEREALLSRRETEIAFLAGRQLDSAIEINASRSAEERRALPQWIPFAACLRATGEMIGIVDLFGIHFRHRYAETGSYLLRPEDRGKGYGSDAKHLLLEFAFDRLGMHVVQSRVRFSNTRSAAALRKQGYRDAGRLTWTHPVDGAFGNDALFDLLASEWRALPRRSG